VRRESIHPSIEKDISVAPLGLECLLFSPRMHPGLVFGRPFGTLFKNPFSKKFAFTVIYLLATINYESLLPVRQSGFASGG
jgi:hypothetical protein